MPNVMTISEAVRRAKAEGYSVTECCLRRWIKCGEIPYRTAGRKILLFYPNLVSYLRCDTSKSDSAISDIMAPGIRRVEV